MCVYFYRYVVYYKQLQLNIKAMPISLQDVFPNQHERQIKALRMEKKFFLEIKKITSTIRKYSYTTLEL